MRIADYIQHADSSDLDAFITRLNDDEAKVQQNLRSFVVGKQLYQRMDDLLTAVGQRLAEGKDIGRFLYGSFGSGKSHLMTVLGKMLERDEAVYLHGHASLRQLHQNHPWLDERKVLVVRLNMMGYDRFERALYEAFNAALPPEVPKVFFSNDAQVFELIEADARRLGGLETLLEQVQADMKIPPAFYHMMRHGTQEQRMDLAAKLLTWRNHGQKVATDQMWLPLAEGLDRIARHAQAHGYGAVTWLVDELVIWIRGKKREEYVQTINELSAMVDHNTPRVLPFFVALAVQTDIATTCPQDISEKDFREHLGFVSNRFQPALVLEDQDLYEVAAQRVLRRREDVAPADRQKFEQAIDQFLSKEASAIQQLAGDVPMDRIRSLYPFHPAILRVLIDVTQALSRSRTALAGLYGLLARYPDLEVGKFLPLGALWEILYSSGQIADARQNAQSQAAQQFFAAWQAWERLEGKVSAQTGGDPAEQRKLATLVQSVLLCQLSQRGYFADGRSLREAITAQNLYRLNLTDVQALMERTGVARVAQSLRTLNGVAPEVQVTGDANNPTVAINTQQADTAQVLAAARSEVDHNHRFKLIRKLLIEQLGLELGTGNENRITVAWRGTERKGRLRLANVRTLSYAGSTNDFDPGSGSGGKGDEFLVLVDYPFDEEPGRGRPDDVEALERAKGRGGQWTMAWLPAHFTASELDALTNAAAVELVKSDENRFLQKYSRSEALNVKQALESYLGQRKAELEASIRKVYFEDGQIHVMKPALNNFPLGGLAPTVAVQKLAQHILSARYPHHPTFGRKLNKNDLAQVADWVVVTARTGQPKHLTANEMQAVDAFALPLELAYKGPNSITAKSDGRYLGPVLRWVGDQPSFEAQTLRALLMAENGWGFGLTKDVADLFLYYLLGAQDFRADQAGRSLTVQGLSQLPEQFKLVKARVVTHSQWDDARSVAKGLLKVTTPADVPNPPAQSKLAREVQAALQDRLPGLRKFKDLLVSVSQWAGALSATKLAQVTTLEGVLSTVLIHTEDFDRMLRLAEQKNHAQMPQWRKILDHLPQEQAGLEQILQHKSTYGLVAASGTEAEKSGVVQRLQNLLQDGYETSMLHTEVQVWRSALDKAVQRIQQDLAKKPVETLPVDDGEVQRQIAEALAAEQERLRKEAELKALAAEKARLEAEAQAAAELRKRQIFLPKLLVGAPNDLMEQARQHLQEALAHLPAEEKLQVRLTLERVP